MTGVRKIRTNRANAQASTGPRTAEGRARSAQNARRHGLSISVSNNPSYSSAIEGLAQEIAGVDASPVLIRHAKPVAEAQLDITRVRRARLEFFAQKLSQEAIDDRALKAAQERLLFKMNAVRPLFRKLDFDQPVPAVIMEFLNSEPLPRLLLAKRRQPGSIEAWKLVFQEHAKPLFAFDRYERRALSRRKFAIRVFDAAKRAHAHSAHERID
jgi:hypothetical protein